MATAGIEGEVVVIGAGGRAGRAVAAEALRRGRQVTGVLREPRHHLDLVAEGRSASIVSGDLTVPGNVRSALAAAGAAPAALVSAVTPFSAPPASFDDFDGDHFVQLVEHLADLGRATGARVVEIGLFATLHSGHGRVLDDPEAFPTFLRPFGQARLRGLERWREHPDVDWLVATPPPGLSAEAPRTGRYRLTDGDLDPELAALPLSYADLAVAVLDQIEHPTHRRTQVGVHATRAVG